MPVESSLALFCKSYKGDLLRAARLMDSIDRFNTDQLPVYLSVPQSDLPLFQDMLGVHRCEWLTDETIVSANPSCTSARLHERYKNTSGGRSQQVIKSEAWRLIDCDVYVSLDSDAEFLRPFCRQDFLAPSGDPYTVIHQCKQYLLEACNAERSEVMDDFLRESVAVREVFGRVGVEYDFGPAPFVWSSRVWRDLEGQYLNRQGVTIWDAIDQIPLEMRWYGEALLAYSSIHLCPVEPLFRVYHHDWQFDRAHKTGETIETVQKIYLGWIKQSNWDMELDMPGARRWSSILGRRIKRMLRS